MFPDPDGVSRWRWCKVVRTHIARQTLFTDGLRNKVLSWPPQFHRSQSDWASLGFAGQTRLIFGGQVRERRKKHPKHHNHLAWLKLVCFFGHGVFYYISKPTPHQPNVCIKTNWLSHHSFPDPDGASSMLWWKVVKTQSSAQTLLRNGLRNIIKFPRSQSVRCAGDPWRR